MIRKNFITVELQYYVAAMRALLARKRIRLRYRCRVTNTAFEGFNVISEGAYISNLEIGRHSYVGVRSIVNNCCIGRFTCIGPNVTIGIGTHPTNRKSIHPVFYSTRAQSGTSFTDKDLFAEHSRTRIGNDVWIGAGVIVRDGVTIGDGAIIGAGAVVTKDVPSYGIMIGNPAKVLRYRYSPEMIAETLASPWWELPDADLRDRIEEFTRDLNDETR